MLPDQVDCMIIGTGLTNAIVAAACSRIGQTVLHIDKNNFYGNQWASFTFQQLIDWFKTNDPENPCLASPPPAELIDKSRMFCIDLTPRYVFSNGPMVDLLVKSNVSRYHDFKNNIRILSVIDDKIQTMPCSRSDVFNSHLLDDLVLKRRLMRFIESCVKETIEPSDLEKPIKPYLSELSLSENLQHFVINSIAMVKPESSTREAAKLVKNFVFATEKYGVCPFLFPLYGCGEYPQSFCRLSAVFGGTYCLNTDVVQILKDETKFSVKLPDATIKSDNLVIEHEYLNKFDQIINPSNIQNKYLARAILITKQSISVNDDSLLSFMRTPTGCGTNKRPVYLIELNSSVMVCPQDYNIIYLWTEMDHNSEDKTNQDLESQFSAFFKALEVNNSNLNIIWKVFFKQSCASIETDIHGLYISNPPSCDDIDYSTAINEARQIFLSINPDKEFLPRAPDSGEIITEQ